MYGKSTPQKTSLAMGKIPQPLDDLKFWAITLA